MSDPVARPEVLAGLRELRRSAAVAELVGVGHYPQIEAPERLSEAIMSATSAL
jgi:pimeloyl-ACP methyl ester carboxylesterase